MILVHQKETLSYQTPLSIPKETIKPKGRNEGYEVVLQFGGVGKETYSLLDYPPVKNTSLLAQLYREEILKDICLDKVVGGMISSADLINLAYWALAARGTDDLLVPVSKLQDQLRKASLEANLTIDISII